MNASTEVKRLQAVRRYDILDTPPDGNFDRITALAARFFNVPISIVSIVDDDRIWFKSHHGLDVQQIDRDPGLCASAILQEDIYAVLDARVDPRTLANPLVAGEFGLRFYAAAPLCTSGGFKLGTICVIDCQPRQITEAEKRTLADLAAIVMHELELRLATKRAVETEMVLRQEALAATRAKSEFLATMSHELRTPMNGVIGIAELLLNIELTPQQRSLVEIIHKSGDTLLTIINDILDFSKIESGKLELEERPFNILDCIENAFDLLAIKAAEKGLKLTYLIDRTTPSTIIGDATRLQQILLNLLSNAVKFTKAGEVTVSVTSQPVIDSSIAVHNNEQLTINYRQNHYSNPQSDEVQSSGFRERGTLNREQKEKKIDSTSLKPELLYKIQFAVKDKGIGIPPEGMDRLFKSFSQVDSSITRQYGGTGLGLAICKRLTKMMNGSMWVESEVGVGSTFYFTIVASASTPQERSLSHLDRDRQCLHIAPANSHPPEASPLRIIVAEDNKLNQQVALQLLQRLGYQADVVGNGIELLEAMRCKTYDVVLMDVQMPEMDGLAATRHICQEWQHKSRPRLVAMTANAMQGDRQACFDVGMDDYISKPIRLQELVRALSNCKPLINAEKQMLSARKPDKYFSVSSHPATESEEYALSNASSSDKGSVLTALGTPIDVNILEEFKQILGKNASEMVANLIDCYLEDAPNLLSSMKTAVFQADAIALRMAVHTLKSSSATLGATTLSNLCKELEAMSRNGNLENASAKVAGIEAEYERVKVALQPETQRSLT